MEMPCAQIAPVAPFNFSNVWASYVLKSFCMTVSKRGLSFTSGCSRRPNIVTLDTSVAGRDIRLTRTAEPTRPVAPVRMRWAIIVASMKNLSTAGVHEVAISVLT